MHNKTKRTMKRIIAWTPFMCSLVFIVDICLQYFTTHAEVGDPCWYITVLVKGFIFIGFAHVIWFFPAIIIFVICAKMLFQHWKYVFVFLLIVSLAFVSGDSRKMFKEALVNDCKEIETEFKIVAAKHGYGADKLDKLVHDPDWRVRWEVADHGYSLEELVDDKSPGVRAAVARQGYGLDVLMNDPDPYVRATVARQGYGLDKLVYDSNKSVRKVVAEQGYGLDKLINDPVDEVRAAVAKQGYGLDVLIDDPYWLVRSAVEYYMKGHNLKESDIRNNE